MKDRQKQLRRIAVSIAAAMLLLWTLALFLTPYAARQLLTMRGVDDSAAGVFGDMFGAINSLFSGLALAGIAFTMYVQTQEKRREPKPFIVPHLDGIEYGSVRIEQPSRRSGSIVLPVRVKAKLVNVTADIAVNVSTTATLSAVSGNDVSQRTTLKLPVFKMLDTLSIPDSVMELRVSGADANALVDALTRKNNVDLTLTIVYQNIEQVEWTSSVKYSLFLNENFHGEHSAYLKACLDDGEQEPSEVGEWATKGGIYLEVSTVSDSWSYKSFS